MNNKKSIGIALIIIGVVLLIGSLTVDLIGIGGNAGFGRYQSAGIVVGVLAAGAGIVLRARNP
jgi:hypothetical protein